MRVDGIVAEDGAAPPLKVRVVEESDLREGQTAMVKLVKRVLHLLNAAFVASHGFVALSLFLKHQCMIF